MDQGGGGRLSGSDQYFLVIELVTVTVIALLVLAMLAFFVFWVIYGKQFDEVHKRLVDAMAMLNNDWKAGLLLVVLLFYRTVRTFLEKARRWGPVEQPTAIIEDTEEKD